MNKSHFLSVQPIDSTIKKGPKLLFQKLELKDRF